jgi:hypothetical protein
MAAADLRNLRMRETHKKVKSWKNHILLHEIERANDRINEFGILGSANLNIITAQTLIRNGIREFRNHYEIRLTHSSIY